MLDIRRHAAWPERLGDVIERHRAQPFTWGEYDCATLFAECVHAVGDVDPLAAYRPWSDAQSAARILMKSGYSSVAHLVSALFPEIGPAFARRGDLGFTRDTGPLACPFVIVGAEAVSHNEHGFIVVPREAIVRTFGVG